MSSKLRSVPFLFVFVLVLLGFLSTGAQPVFAQADPPLNFANNYFVRGDFTLAGAQGMLSNFTNINGVQFAVGTITVPDKNPGINPSVLTGSGSNAVPANAEIVAAVLYWQTVEKVGVTPGGPGSGQNGFFRPVITGGPVAPGYVISGVPLSSGSNAVSWSSGGCTSGSTGKVVRTYRANVASLLPRDINGNVLANNTYEVRLPGTSSTTPIAVGASLILIYRVLNPNVPLNSIVIYDGDFAPSASSLLMLQTIQGFYDADSTSNHAASRLAHIVGNGKTNKFETVSLNGTQLPSPYPRGEPPFPGYYGSWDNTVWSFGLKNNPVGDGSSSVTTEVMPSSSMGGCVSWGASIVSTTVKSSSNDGLVDSWKGNGGYCDAAVNAGVCTKESASWVDLPNATVGKQDVYIQLDYMCSQVTGGDSCTTGDKTNYSFDPRLAMGADGVNAVQKVVNAYASHGITLHVNPSTDQPDVHAIQEPVCQDNPATNPPTLCPFPNPPGTTTNLGVLTWTGGFYSIKSQLIDPNDPTNPNACAGNPAPAYCVPRFQSAAAPAKHYVVFGHAVGQPKWSLIGGSLINVSQSGNTVTFTTSLPVGLLNNIGPDPKNPITDPTCKEGRVTVFGAATNPYMNGTYCISSSTNTSFSITIGGTATKKATSFTLATDPNIAVAPGYTSTASGVSDVGGANTYGSLGLWGNPADSTSDGQNPVFIAGALMHEFGHANGLAHGGPVASFIQGQPGALLPQILTNCKPNYQSAMSYSRLGDTTIDYSSGALSSSALNKKVPGTLLSGTGDTFWYVPWPAYFDANGNPIGSAASAHCNGTAITDGAKMSRQGPFPLSSFSWQSPNPALPNSPDINFDGNTTETMLDLNDWKYLDLAQIGATGANSSSSGPQFNGGGPQFNGGGPQFNGGGPQFNGGGPQFNGGGPQFNGGGEIDEATANSVTGSATGVTATEAQSPRTIMLNWTAPTFGQIGSYNIYRSLNGTQSFSKIATVSNPPATNYTDTMVACNPTGYQYFVTSVLSDTSVNPGQESSPSNTVTVTSPNLYLMTGCYTNVPDPFTPPNPQTTPPTNAPPTQVKLTDLSFGSSPVVQGSTVPITWTLQADNTSDYANPYVSNPAANSLYYNGPVANNGCTNVTPGQHIPLVVNGVVQNSAGSFTQVGNTFTFSWSTDAFCAGSYTFELDTDSGQVEKTTSALTLSIDINDQDNPTITTMGLPGGTVGAPYNYLLTEDGGTPSFTWNVPNLPPGISISQNPAGSANLSGTTCVAGAYNSIYASVTDAKGNTGTRTLTLQISQANTTTSVVSSANPSVFQQALTFTVTVAPQNPCTPTGTVTLYDGASAIGFMSLTGGMATFALPLTTYNPSVGVHTMTAKYSGDSNFNPSTSAVWSQTVNPAMTAISFSPFSPSTTLFVGQPITVSYTFGVVAPGAGSPIAPTGNISVTATDNANPTPHNSSCVAMPTLGGGMCTLSPAPAAAGAYTFTINYTGDGNFVTSGANGNYTVYQLVLTAQPGNTGVGLPITPAVAVTAEDYMGKTYTSFTGGITVAIGSGPGTATLSGTTTQNAVSGVATFNNLSINQIANGYTLTAAPSGGVPDATSNAFNIDTFYVDNQGNFGTLDLALGTVTQLGAGTVPGSNGIDLTPSLQVYAYNASNQLWQIIPSPLAATQVGTGTTGSIPDQATTGALTNGSYFAIDAITGTLYSINLSNGATNSLGATGAGLITAVPAGCNLESSLSGSATTLYYTVGYSGASCTSPLQDTLYAIDPTGQTPTSTVALTFTVGGPGVNGFVGSAFVGGTLYGFTAGGGEYSIAPATGVATLVVNTNPLTPIVAAGSSQ